MATSSLGKLDAICAKLKSSQLTALGTKAQNGTGGTEPSGTPECNTKDDVVVGRLEQEPAVVAGGEGSANDHDDQSPGRTLGTAQDKTAEGETAGGLTLVPLANGSSERDDDVSSDAKNERHEKEGTSSKVNGLWKQDANNGDNEEDEKECSDALAIDSDDGHSNGNNACILNNNINNNNNNKTQDFNEKAEADVSKGLHASLEMSESVNHNNEAAVSSSPSSSSLDHMTCVPNEDVPHDQSSVFDDRPSSKEVLMMSPSSLSSSVTSTPSNAQSSSTTSSLSPVSSLTQSSSSSSSSSLSLSSSFLSSTPSNPMNSNSNPSDIKGKADSCQMLESVSLISPQPSTSQVRAPDKCPDHSVTGVNQTEPWAGSSSSQGSSINNMPHLNGSNNSNVNPDHSGCGISRVTCVAGGCIAVSQEGSDESKTKPTSHLTAAGITAASNNDRVEKSNCNIKDSSNIENTNNSINKNTDESLREFCNSEKATEGCDQSSNVKSQNSEIYADQTSRDAELSGKTVQEPSSQPETTVLSPSKSGDIEEKANPDIAGSTCLSAHSETTVTSGSGRRNRRKAAKPQKQVGGRFYTNEYFMEETSFTSDNLSGVRAESNEPFSHAASTDEACDLVPQPTPSGDQTPLDLSSGNFDSIPNEPQSLARRDASSNEEAPPSLPDGTKMAQGNEEDDSSKTKRRRRGRRTSSSSGADSSNADANSLLVDYAKNTMSELLGIYGFEGADARADALGNLPDFPNTQVDASSLFPRAADTSPAGQTQTARSSPAGQTQTARSSPAGQTHTPRSSRATKSGPFVKKVYTSLMTPASANDVAKSGFHLQVPSLPLAVGTAASSQLGNGQAKEGQISNGKLTGNSSTCSVPRKNYTTKALNSADCHKYIRRYGNGIDCGGEHCKDLGYRDHYHCQDCPHKVFIRKEEMVRHFKWHKKRQESLQHGFMRYSPMDDCSKRFGSCAHNGRQTHYHCVQRGCDKVYISTSDVQMHANFHRKDSAIIQEGFQRFRATEDCGSTSCAFYGHRTTHFHCRRPQCNFTFKNKSDMEKHKSYHQKDQVLSKDGFKKFMKYEACPYVGCRYSKSSNHIHCIRPGCQYVLHSTAQLYSHKRKHERREFENAYRSFRQLQHQTPNQLTGKSGKGQQSRLNPSSTPGRSTSPGNMTVVPLPASKSAITSQAIATGQIPSGTLALQGVQLDGDILTSLKANSLHLPKSSISPKKEVEMASALNLTHQSNVLQLGKTREKDEERQTMALPVSLMQHPIKPEFDDDNDDSCEAEDLSLNKKRKAEDLEDSLSSECSSKVVIKEEVDLSSDDNRNPDDGMSGIEDEEDEDDDDDDDEDDDKDYGQVEEPTLVNNMDSSGEYDKPSSLLNLPINAVKRENEEAMVTATTPIKVEPGTLDVKQESKSGFSEAATCPLSSTPPAKSLLTDVPMQMKTSVERKERDESWKKYLIRFTANDACYSRCGCLYKDHYHCRVEGCQVIFKSKDGVRGHARFHENQDSITPLVYSKFDISTPCQYVGCQYTEKELHFHCNWSKCKQVIPHSGPTFALLEHYRIHECGMNAFNRGTKNTASLTSGLRELDPLQKRRGRPPKYPRDDLPVVPKVHLTEKEIMDSSLAFMHKKYNEESRIINGFKKILSAEKCPDDNCMFQNKDHYHCGRKFCHMSTDRLDFLTLHSKDFHNNVTILEGYEFFERNVNCRRPHCSNNRVNRHYHCKRPRCDYSFVRHSTMVQHNKKHPTAPAAVLTPPAGALPPSQLLPFSNRKSGQQFVAIAPAIVPSSSPLVTISTSSSAASSNGNTSPSTATKSKMATNSNDSTDSKTANVNIFGKTVVKSSGTYFPLSRLPKIQLTSVSGLPVRPTSTAGVSASPSQNMLCTSPSGLTSSTVSNSISGASVPIISAAPLAAVTSSQVIQGAQILQTQNGASVINAGGMCLTLPPNLASSSIPILTPSATNQQPTLLTGIIPVGNLVNSQSVAPQLVNISGAQIIATSQGSFLQHGSVLGSNLVQVIQNPITVISSGTAAATSVLATPGNTLAMTGSVAGTAAPLTLLLQQQMQQQPQQQHQSDGGVLPLSWANLKKKMHYPLAINCGRPFCKLKKKDHYHCLDCYQAFSDPARLRVHLGKHGFKFKKADPRLKNQDGLQDQIVTKVFQGLDLSPQVKKQVRSHSPREPNAANLAASAAEVKSEDEGQGLSSSLNLCPSVFTEMVAKGEEAEAFTSDSSSSKSAEKITLVMSNVNSQWTISRNDGMRSSDSEQEPDVKKQNIVGDEPEKDVSIVAVEPGQSSLDYYDSDAPMLMVDEGLDESNDSSLNTSSSSLALCSSLSRKSRSRRPSVRSKDYIDSETIVDARAPKQRRKYKKDFSVPEGFTHVKCSEDCGYMRCAYRQSVTHFHCLRSNCGYGISDRSRIIQHRVRHERLDALMGGEFQHFRASVTCHRADCEFDEKSSHFHCLKCPFSCADSGRVPAHRKYHSKLDNVSNNGFIKFTGVQDCQTASCYYFRKQTHYHCTFPGCNYSVLGPSQMAPHKLKHAQHSQ